ncbi:MAG: GatB/YqeY domain-containing protein [Deltaproteobacteria bacterium]|nr:GatB/YqeY domain-containing protein [Candidatus Zymogenaceae bacterium]
MPSLKDRLDTDLKEAQKARDTIRVSVIRMLKTAIKNREVEKIGELTEQELLQAVNSQIKARLEAVEGFRKGGREEAAKKEEAEMVILKAYLPEQLTKEEIESLIDKAIAETGAAGPRDMGKVMKALMSDVTGKADGKLVSELVKEKLSSVS